jgi:hypothetical protein
MKRQPKRMRRDKAEQLSRLFTQLMQDLGAKPSPPLEHWIMTGHGPLYLSCLPEIPMFFGHYLCYPGKRFSRHYPIGDPVLIFVDYSRELSRELARYSEDDESSFPDDPVSRGVVSREADCGTMERNTPHCVH